MDLYEADPNPYEANPNKIPSSDRYRAEPFYGRYLPQNTDFKPDNLYINSCTPAALEYWGNVLARCNEANRIYENDDDHRKELPTRSKTFRDYSFADANEKAAIALVRANYPELRVPDIYFANKYLDQSQKQSFKDQARQILQLLHKIRPDNEVTGPTYLVQDTDSVEHRGIQKLEEDMVFGSGHQRTDLIFTHNDFQPSNIIAHDDQIVGLIDWEMAGFFSLEAAKMVHVEIRSPKKENFRSLNLSQDQLDDILFWNDLYTGVESKTFLP